MQMKYMYFDIDSIIHQKCVFITYLHLYLSEQTITNALSGYQTSTIVSPNYPKSDYPDDADISWIVTCEDTFITLILFDELDTESGYDTLTVGNGTDPDDVLSVIVAVFSGSSTVDGAFTLSSHTWLRFTTDNFLSYAGFALTLYPIKEGNNLL